MPLATNGWLRIAKRRSLPAKRRQIASTNACEKISGSTEPEGELQLLGAL
jgi:hypothetical protein